MRPSEISPFLTSSQEPVTGARASLPAGFTCHAAAWGSKPSAAAKSNSSSTCLPRASRPRCTQGSHKMLLHQAGKLKLKLGSSWGSLSPSIPHHWEVTALSGSRDYNLKLMAWLINMKVCKNLLKVIQYQIFAK